VLFEKGDKKEKRGKKKKKAERRRWTNWGEILALAA